MRHNRLHTTAIASSLLGLALLASACGSSNNRSAANTNTRPPTVGGLQTLPGAAPAAVSAAVSGLSQQLDQLAAPIKGANATQLKQQALDSCHRLRDQVKSSGATITDQVNRFCTQIQSANPDDRPAWNAIKQQLQALKDALGA